MAEGTLTLNTVTYMGDGPFGGPALDFRFGNETIGTASITQSHQTVTFSNTSKPINGIDFVRVYQNGEPCRGMFISAVSASNYGPGTCECTAGVYGGGHLILSYTVS